MPVPEKVFSKGINPTVNAILEDARECGVIRSRRREAHDVIALTRNHYATA
jgi:hypothetical protein